MATREEGALLDMHALWCAAARDIRAVLLLMLNVMLRVAVTFLQQLADAIALLGVVPR